MPEDYVLAYACLNLAAAQGNKNAVEGKDIVRPRMTADQIAAAQKLSASLDRSRCLGNLSAGALRKTPCPRYGGKA